MVLTHQGIGYMCRLLLSILCSCMSVCVPAVGQRLPGASAPLEINYRSAQLQVKANGVALGVLLEALARRLQVQAPTIDAAVASSRIHGTFGPADPHDVIAQILSTTGADYLIVSRGNRSRVAEVLVFKRAAASPLPLSTPPPEAPAAGEADLAADRERIADDPSPEDMAGPGREIKDDDLEAVEPRRKTDEESPEPR